MKKLGIVEAQSKLRNKYYHAIEDLISPDNPFAKMVKMGVENSEASIRAERTLRRIMLNIISPAKNLKLCLT